MDVVFVWSDQLADMVVDSDVDLSAAIHRRMDAWRLRPTGHRLPDGVDALTYGLGLLGLEPPIAVASCPCGALPAAPHALAETG